MAAAPRVGRLRSSPLSPPPPPARAPRSALCAAGLPRAPLTPGGRRRSRQRPSPWPAGARGPPRPRPLAPSRARPALGPALAPAQSLSRSASPLRDSSPGGSPCFGGPVVERSRKKVFPGRSNVHPWWARKVLLLGLFLDPKLSTAWGERVGEKQCHGGGVVSLPLPPNVSGGMEG